MNPFAQYSVRNRLLLSYAVLIIISCVIGISGLIGMMRMKSRIDDIHVKLIPSIMMAGEMDRHAKQYRKQQDQFLQNADVGHRRELTVLLDREEQELRELFARFARFELVQEEKKLLADTLTASAAYLDAARAQREAAVASPGGAVAETEQLFALFVSQEMLINRLARYNVEAADLHYTLSGTAFGRLRIWFLLLFAGSIAAAALMTALITRGVLSPLKHALDAVMAQQQSGTRKAQIVQAIAAGDLSHDIEVLPLPDEDEKGFANDEIGSLMKALIESARLQHVLDQSMADMLVFLRRTRQQDEQREWFKNGHGTLGSILRGDKPIEELTQQLISFLAEYLGAGVGVFYLYDDKAGKLVIESSYAFTQRKRLGDTLALGEGLAGQAARERKLICLYDAPHDYLPISSGLGEASPASIVALPLVYDTSLIGLIELGSFAPFKDREIELLTQSMEGIAITLSVGRSRQLVNELLAQTQSQTEELRVQQEELQQTNEELEERAQLLDQQRQQILLKNQEVEIASNELRDKAEELERVSKYKSEFLANMSHELRTPLNSMMILSSILKDNRENNLTAKQVEFAATINSAGRDLLNLINDILDISKIEAGRLEFHYDEFSVQDVLEQLQGIFEPIATEKGIALNIVRQDNAPVTMLADSQRTMQILKNLLSNACKFTKEGTVTLRIWTPEPGTSPLATECAAFSVSDTGIGIPEEKQGMIFNAFQQADGSTSRIYGGTGLGLSISRQLARTMGGEITVQSAAGSGSMFTLFLPVRGVTPTVHRAAEREPAAREKQGSPVREMASPPGPSERALEALPAPIPDDRDRIQPGTKTKCILVIEDDLTFAAVLADMVRGRGFCLLAAADGESGIAMAERYRPSAIILDVMLPHIDGWGVMRSLKDNPATRHIPVHFITCLDQRKKAMGMGAIGYISKPVDTEQLASVFDSLESAIAKTMKTLLIVEDNANEARAMESLLGERDVQIRVASSGAEAIELLSREPFDCIVLDLGLADMGAYELLDSLKKIDPDRRIPVIIHTGRELTQADELKLRHYAESIIIKGAKSPERLLNEVTLFLHLVETSLDPDKQRMIRSALDKEAMLDGKKVLIVDDDMRNIFSLSSALAEKNMAILEAENGREALKQLDEHPDIDIALIDIMMPEMDGYATMRAIRKDPRFAKLPIIALTAKAMKGDREDCLNAGASDYIPKPVNMDKLFSMLRVWLYSSAASDSVDLSS